MLNLNKNHHRHPELDSGSTRHCEQSEAISSRLPRATALAMTNETGRSMVEMLGVLAVIGVLSITGISGYTTAMNKHRANEIADGATKRAMAVASQIQLGNTNPTLGEFGDSTANTIQGVEINTPTKVGDDQFKLLLTWESDSTKTTLCKELKNVISTTGTGSASLIDTDCSRILFNNDMSVGVSNTNNRNSDGTACADGYTGADCDSCASGFGKHEGTCAQCPTGSGTTSTYSGSDVPNYTGCKCGADQTWENSQCKSAQKEFYITSSTTDHYYAASQCSNLTVDGGGWRLASAVNDLGCSYGTDCSGTLSGLTYEGTAWQSGSYNLWLSECYDDSTSNNIGSCSSDAYSSGFNVSLRGFIVYELRDLYSTDADFYVLCVR